MKPETTSSSEAACRVVGKGAEFVSKQGHLSSPVISAESEGVQGIHSQVVTIPPGIRAEGANMMVTNRPSMF
jgi:uncharacterized RmlC-like cupin family protein